MVSFSRLEWVVVGIARKDRRLQSVAFGLTGQDLINESPKGFPAHELLMHAGTGEVLVLIRDAKAYGSKRYS